MGTTIGTKDTNLGRVKENGMWVRGDLGRRMGAKEFGFGVGESTGEWGQKNGDEDLESVCGGGCVGRSRWL